MDNGRRMVLHALGAGATAAVMPGAALAQPAPWGTIPTYSTPIWPTAPDLKILEIHLYGGLSMWETFYVRPPGAGNRFRGFDGEMAALPYAGCDAAFTDPAPAPFANDALGHAVHLGPPTRPLWLPAILDKMRIVVLKHEFEPHEAAIPLTLTGFGLGSPKLAGLAAPIQHAFNARAFAAGAAATQPFSYVLWPESFNFPNDNLQASAAIGMHPADARPLVIKIGSGTAGFLGALNRSGVRPERDDLLRQYLGQYRNELRHRALTPAGARNRSRGFTSFEASSGMVLGAGSLLGLLSDPAASLADPLPSNALCPASFSGNIENMPQRAIQVAGYLLSRTGPNAPRYVCVVDKGHRSHPQGGGYDTHSSDHVTHTSFNLFNVCRTLRDEIQNGNLNLANTLIVLSTEFGRDPTRTGAGRDHWPKGYCQILIGGPVTRGVSGAIRDSHFGAPATEDGHADPANHFRPADTRAAILVAAGIMPFETEQFAVQDISFYTAGSTHESLMRQLKSQVLGA